MRWGGEQDGIRKTGSICNLSCRREHRGSPDRFAVDDGRNFTCRIYRTWKGMSGMGKYIIELKQGEMAYKTVDSKGTPMIQLLDPIPYTEPDMKQVKRDYDAFYKHGYEQGLSDAWEAARKIYLPVEYGGIPADVLRQMFDNKSASGIFKKVSASEAVEKIRQYEQEKEEDSRLRRSIKNVMSACDCSLDDITETLQKMKKS